MKKVLALILSLIFIMGTFTFATFAKSVQLEADVYVSISASKDKLNMAYEKIRVTDADDDGSLTINDALICAHDKNFKGGAKSGYKAMHVSGYDGISLIKLWGVENGGSYGYYRNNKMAWSLADVIKNDDHIYAFVYSDTQGWSDAYSFFTENTASADQGKEISLSLKKLSYNASWVLEEKPVKGAVITVDGKETKVKTDSKGKATIVITSPGNHKISAKSPESGIITPPVCDATIKMNIGSLITYYFNCIISAIKSIISR